MWNKIIIGALVLFLLAFYLFFNNYSAIMAEGGDVKEGLKQFDSLVEQQKTQAQDQYTKTYAEMRAEWFSSENSRLEDEKNEFDQTRSGVEGEIAEASSKVETAEAEFKRLEAELSDLVEKLSAAVGTEASGDDTDVIAQAFAALHADLKALRIKLDQESARVAHLKSENERVSGLVDKARKLNAERMARVSPASLSTRVVACDPDWDYAIIGAGLDQGVVLGSRLAVMRGNTKIAELAVTNVEANRASCDVVYSTVIPGESVQAGDLIIAVRNN